MKVDDNGILLLALWERVEPHVYRDFGGLPTIGIGHKLTLSERRSGVIIIAGRRVPYAQGLTGGQIDALLQQDLLPAEQAVMNMVFVGLTQNQFNALVSFVFNVGIGAFQHSTLLTVLNQREYDQVPVQMRRWIYDDGVQVEGLKNRREKEIELWNQA